jgi:peroxin-1
LINIPADQTSSQVEIGLIHAATKAVSVSVTPQSPDDWEVLVGTFSKYGGPHGDAYENIPQQERHTDYLENNLLSQLRAASKGQVVNVWVMGKTKIRLRVGKWIYATERV